MRFLSWDKDNSFYGWDCSMWTNVELNPLAARALRTQRLRGIYLETLEQASAVVHGAARRADRAAGRARGRAGSSARSGASTTRSRTRAHADVNKSFSNETFDEQLAHMVEFSRGVRRSSPHDAR